MNDSNDKPTPSEQADTKQPTWYVDEDGNIKGHWATFVVDQFVEFTDVAKPTPKSHPAS